MSETDREVELRTEQFLRQTNFRQFVDFFIVFRRRARRCRQRSDEVGAAYHAGKAQAYLNCARMLRT